MTPEQKLIEEARRLTNEALDRFGDSPASTVWRLVDAALLAYEAAGMPPDLIGRTFPTGRGARLVIEAGDKASTEEPAGWGAPLHECSYCGAPLYEEEGRYCSRKCARADESDRG